MGNASTITGTALSTPVAPDPNLCRISGYLTDVHGSPLKGWSFVVRHVYSPIAEVSSVLVLRERTVVRADASGFVQFDLLRGSKVDIELPNRLLDQTLHCTTPNAASIDLIDFLFPYVAAVEFVTASPASVQVGESVTVEMKAILSNGVEVLLDGASTTLTSSDESVLRKLGGFSFEALTPGTADLSVTAFNPEPLRLQLQPDGTANVIQSVPSATLPADLTVNIS